jgi:transcriptional regulator with XRE-family HTH domain
MSEKSEAEVVRLTNLLASAIRFSGWKQRDIEKSLGLSSGSMSRLLSGGIELKIKHVLEICEVIGFPPARFFHASYPAAEEGGNDAVRLQRLLEQLHPVPEAAPEPPAAPQAAPASAVNQAEVERMVFGALAKFFSNMGGGPPTQ